MTTLPAVINEESVRRAVEGDLTLALTKSELKAAWRKLEDDQLSIADIAATLGVTVQHIERWRINNGPFLPRNGLKPEQTTPRPPTQSGPPTLAAPTQPVPEPPSLIARGLASDHKPTQVAARKASDALRRLEVLLSTSDDRRKAQERVNELTQELAKAKAKLKGRKEPTAPKPAPEPPTRVDTKAVREWAGIAGRGRLPQSVIDAYVAEHPPNIPQA